MGCKVPHETCFVTSGGKLKLNDANDGYTKFFKYINGVVSYSVIYINGAIESVTHKGSPSPPVPAKPNKLYSRGSFVDIVCWTVG